MIGLETLAGARIDRVDGPGDDLLVFSLRKPGVKEVLAVRLSGPARGVGLLPARPTGQPATPSISKLRHHLVGARIEALYPRGVRGLEIALSGRTRAASLHLVLGRATGNAFVVAADGRVLSSLHPIEAHHRPQTEPETRPQPGDEPTVASPFARDVAALRRAGAGLIGAEPNPDAAARKALAGRVRKRAAQLRRRQAKIAQDIEAAQDADRLRLQASLLLTELHALAPDAREVELTDYGTSPPRRFTVALEDTLGPRQQAEAWFKRARKLARGAQIGRERRAQTARELEALELLLARLQDDAEALSALEAAARALGLGTTSGRVDGAGKSARRDRPARVAYRTFLGAGQRPILVGKGAADNDTLTLHRAAPHDLWLHARGAAGAHVVVPLTRGQACPPDLLADAALLAAHFSRYRNDSQVEVTHVERRHVRKPKGSPPGQVTVAREKVLLLRQDPERLRALLKTEQIG